MNQSVLEIAEMDENGTQHFKVDGVLRYSIYTFESVRGGNRYAVRPNAHIGRNHVVADLGEAFALAMDAVALHL